MIYITSEEYRLAILFSKIRDVEGSRKEFRKPNENQDCYHKATRVHGQS